MLKHNVQLLRKVDGRWSEWGSWESCSVTCGGGERPRYRECDPPLHGGLPCVGPDVDVSSCNPDPCPIDGVWEAWSVWAACDLTCGGGSRGRQRGCREPKYGGQPCDGPTSDTGSCNTHPCPIDGKWLSWGGWQECDRTCGGGLRVRERVCDPPRYGGLDCIGAREEEGACNEHPCPMNAFWESWEIWDRCSVSCAGGTRRRSRICIPPKYGGLECSGDDSQEEECNTYPCPVNAEWLSWDDWTGCSRSCDGGHQTRNRTCIAGKHGGRACGPHGDQERECNNHPCPIDGHWLTWGPWGHCSDTCGGGTQVRERRCFGTKYGGRECTGPDEEDQDCNEQPCPIDGIWDPWSEWSSCDVSCGGGTRYKNRYCSGPWHGGYGCYGEDAERESCGTITCFKPRPWNLWGPWTPCSVSCGGGNRVRYRSCNLEISGPLYTPECAGEEMEEDWCHAYSCTPLAHSCSEWKNRGMVDTSFAQIAPTSISGPVWVVCNMSIDPKTGFTQVAHNCTDKIEVRGVDYEAIGGFKMPIKYNVSFNALLEIIRVSKTCKQFIRWECHSAAIKSPYDSRISITFWKNRNGETRTYWGGADHRTNNCACGMSDSCVLPGLKCNCDANDEVLREDSGHLVYKPDLPVTEVRAGDTGGINEYGYYTLGPILCHD